MTTQKTKKINITDPTKTPGMDSDAHGQNIGKPNNVKVFEGKNAKGSKNSSLNGPRTHMLTLGEPQF